MVIALFATLFLSTSSSSTTITLTAITILLLVLNIFINALKHQSKPKHPPLPPGGPAPWPIIGNVPELLRNKPTFRWLHNLLEEMNTQIACVRFGNVHVNPVICPKIALEFLKDQDALFASRPLTMATDIFSRGHLTTIFPPFNDQWKKMRKVFTSEILSPARHRWLHDKRTEEADNLVKYVYNQSASTGLVKLRTASRHYAGNVIRKMVFNKRYFGEGMKDGGSGFEEEEHVNAIFTALRYFYSFCISDYFHFLVGFYLDGHEKHVKEAFRIVNKYHDPLIDERMKKWRHSSVNNPNNVIQKEEPQDLLDVLISLKDTKGKPLLSPDELKAQTVELMIAAIDNPSNAVEWAMAEMINETALLQKAIEELDMVVGKERLVQESDIPRLNFIKACAREAFRLHPIAPFNPPHVAMSDTTVAGYFIPKGSQVILSRMGLGRNPKVWDEPLKFKPDRHLDDECSKVVLTEPHLRFISFSTGRRGCIAANLGRAMTTMLLARLLQGFTWSPPPNVSSIDLSESEDDLFLAKPLVAHAKCHGPNHDASFVWACGLEMCGSGIFVNIIFRNYLKIHYVISSTLDVSSKWLSKVLKAL